MQLKNTTTLLASLAFVLASTACKEEEPCDEGQTYEYQACLDPPPPPPPSEPEASEPEASSDSADAGADPSAGDDDDSAEEPALDTDFNDACEDDVASSDCGGTAPVCLPQLFICSQIFCGEGEANEGVCPDGWLCIMPPGAPSTTCLDPAVLGG